MLFDLLHSKRAEGNAAGAAVLIVLIGLLIVLYILFLPPAERCELLDNCSNVRQPPGVTPGGNSQVIFTSVPDDISNPAPEVYPLPGFEVRTLTAGNVLIDRTGVSLSRSVFHNNNAEISFSVPDSTENILLSFGVVAGQGNLRLVLNGETIFDGPVSQRQPPAISLPNSLLQPQNVLEVEASSVGFSFWQTNRYELSYLRIVGDTTSFEEASQTQRFVLDDLDEVERVTLRFVPDCLDVPSRMLLRLNGATIYSGRHACNDPFFTDLAPARLLDGENTLTWDVEGGSYFISQAEVVVERTAQAQDDSFTLTAEMLNRVVTENRQVHLGLSFVSPGAEGVLRINGRDLAFRTHQRSFAGPITNYVVQGENTIEVVSATKDVTLLEVRLV